MAEDDDRQRLEQAELFAPGLIHEMRHPLMGIKAGLQLIGRQLGEATTNQPEWTIVLSQLARLEELYRTYQEFLDPEATPPSVFVAGAVVKQALSLVQYRTRSLGARFTVEPGPPSLFCHGVPNALAHALINLVVNAVEAVEETPDAEVQVRVLASARGGCQVRVSDQGSGIEPQARTRLFSARFTTKAKGTGLGLHVARRMIESFGGSLTLVDERDPLRFAGAKTEFCIELAPVTAHTPLPPRTALQPALPRVPAPLRAQAGTSEAAQFFEVALAEFRQSSDRGQRVLVVDDDPGVLSFFARLLPSLGLQFELAASARQAMEHFGRGLVNLAIVDKNLADETGISLLRRLKEGDPFMEVMVITAFPSVETLLEAFRLGAADYLEKPLQDLDVVSARIRAVVRRQTLRARTHRLAQRLESTRNDALEQLPAAQQAQIERLLALLTPPAPEHRLVAFGTPVFRSRLAGLVGVEPVPAQTLEELGRLLDAKRVDAVLVDPAQTAVPLDALGKVVRPRLGAHSLVAISENPSREHLLASFGAGAIDFISLEPSADVGWVQERLQLAVQRSRQHQRDRGVIRLLLDLDLDEEPEELQKATPLPFATLSPLPFPTLTPVPDSTPGHVLVVDDEEIILSMLRRALSSTGWKVAVARTGPEGLALIGSGQFDALVTDKNLSGPGGVELARAIRKKNPAAAIMIMTGYPSRQSAAAVLKIDVDEYVIKPFELDYLAERMTVHMARRREAARRTRAGARKISRVVVINPDERERSRLVTVVGGMGLKTAAGGELTREIFSDARQGLIISREALTPEGRVILEEVRNAHPDLAVAFISGADGIPDSVDAILVGAFGHLIRPWPDQQLADLLKGGLGL